MAWAVAETQADADQIAAEDKTAASDPSAGGWRMLKKKEVLQTEDEAREGGVWKPLNPAFVGSFAYIENAFRRRVLNTTTEPATPSTLEELAREVADNWFRSPGGITLEEFILSVLTRAVGTMQGEVKRKNSMLLQAAATFDEYSKLHYAKKTPAGDYKATVNYAMAEACRAATDTPKGEK